MNWVRQLVQTTAQPVPAGHHDARLSTRLPTDHAEGTRLGRAPAGARLRAPHPTHLVRTAPRSSPALRRAGAQLQLRALLPLSERRALVRALRRDRHVRELHSTPHRPVHLCNAASTTSATGTSSTRPTWRATAWASSRKRRSRRTSASLRRTWSACAGWRDNPDRNPSPSPSPSPHS